MWNYLRINKVGFGSTMTWRRRLTTGMTIRDATPDDETTLLGFLRDLQDFERALCVSRRPGHEVARHCYDELRNASGHILLAIDEDEAAGFVAGGVKVDEDALQIETWRSHGHISDLYVAPAHRRRGVAQRLLAAMADRLRGEGANRLTIGALSANHAAVATYQRFGFQPFQVRLEMDLA